MAHKVAIINGKAPSGGNGGVSDADLSNIAVNFLNAGVVATNDYKIEEQGTPNMTVKVNTGKAYILNSAGTMMYVSSLDASVNATIASNASGNPRIDAVVIKLDLSVTPDLNAANVASIVVVQGTPAASPSAPSDPAIQTAVGAGNPFYRLANVTVANGAVSITNANIASTRSTVSLKTSIVPIAKGFFATHENGALFGANQTTYTRPGDLNPNTTEANRKFFVPAGTSYGLYIGIDSNTINGSTTVTLRKNGSSTAIAVTIGTGATGFFLATGTVTNVDGDYIDLQWVINGSSGQLGIASVMLTFEPTN